MDKKLIINKKTIKGEDGYKVFSIRAKDETASEPDELARLTNRFRNELINILLEFAIRSCEVQ